MRRGAHRSRSTTGDSGQIRLDFVAPDAATAAGTAVVGPSPAPVTAAAGTASVGAATRAARGRSSGRRSEPVSDAPAAAPPAPRGGTVLFLDRRRSAAARCAAARSAAPQRSAGEWFELGCELETSAPAEARTAYLNAIAADDRHADAHLNVGRLLHEAGDLRGAERHYRLALEIEPGEATAAFNLGVVLEDLRRDVQAIAAYERAMTADPDFLDAYHNVVRLHERRGDKAAALRVLKRLRERTR